MIFWQKWRQWEKKKSFFWLTILLTMVLIGESLWIGKLFNSKAKPVKLGLSPTAAPAAARLLIKGPKALTAGQEATATIYLRGLKTENLAGLDVVLKFPAASLKIIDAVTNQTGVQVKVDNRFLGQVARNLVDKQHGRIFLSWLNFERQGAALLPGDLIKLAEIKLVATKPGRVSLKFLKVNTQLLSVLDNKLLPWQGVNWSAEVH